MSAGYLAIGWSRHKRVYDALAAASIVLYIGLFIVLSRVIWGGAGDDGGASDEVLLLRATGSCAIVLLHVVLAIGPLARLEPRFLPLLFNRRHLGVMTFLVGLVHGVVSIGYYHGFGVMNPLVSLLTSNVEYGSISAFPYQVLGAGGLVIMFLLASTSHDFWNRTLGPRVWKWLHMSVYLAYALLIGHVVLGGVQTDRSHLASAALVIGAACLIGLHLAAGVRERRGDAPTQEPGDAKGWLDAGLVDEIPMDRARIVCAGSGERIAVFRHKGGVSAITNVCAHQGGPLGEGRVIDGCVTCPWHGWQYKPEDGCSPPPFNEKVRTYDVRIEGGRVRVKTEANPPGTLVAPATAARDAKGVA